MVISTVLILYSVTGNECDFSNRFISIWVLFSAKKDKSCKLWLQMLHTAKKDEGNWLRRSKIATVFVITAKRGCAADSRC